MTEHEDEEPLMLDLVKEYSNFNRPASATEEAPKSEGQEVVVRSHSQRSICQILIRLQCKLQAEFLHGKTSC